MQYLPNFETSGAFPFARSTCVLSALPTSPWSNRPRNRPPLPAPCTLWETAMWMVLFRFRFWLCCFTWNYISNVFATFSPSCSWQKGDRPDNGNVEPCSNQPKKKQPPKPLATKLLNNSFVHLYPSGLNGFLAQLRSSRSGVGAFLWDFRIHQSPRLLQRVTCIFPLWRRCFPLGFHQSPLLVYLC